MEDFLIQTSKEKFIFMTTLPAYCWKQKHYSHLRNTALFQIAVRVTAIVNTNKTVEITFSNVI